MLSYYQQKYIKYKMKYLQLKNIRQTGGNISKFTNKTDELFGLFICGPPGTGKSSHVKDIIDLAKLHNKYKLIDPDIIEGKNHGEQSEKAIKLVKQSISKKESFIYVATCGSIGLMISFLKLMKNLGMKSVVAIPYTKLSTSLDRISKREQVTPEEVTKELYSFFSTKAEAYMKLKDLDEVYLYNNETEFNLLYSRKGNEIICKPGDFYFDISKYCKKEECPLLKSFEKPISFIGTHTLWVDILEFLNNKKFKRLHGLKDAGSWKIINDKLILTWDKYSEIQLQITSDCNKFIQKNNDGTIELTLQYTTNPNKDLDIAKNKRQNKSIKLTKSSASVIFRLKNKTGYKYLFQHRGSNISNGNKLGLPGGIQEKSDKNFIHTAYRECIEEDIPFKNFTMKEFEENILYTIPIHTIKDNITNEYINIPGSDGQVNKHIQFIVNADNLKIDNTPPKILNKELSYDTFKNGYMWISEEELDKYLNNDINNINKLKIWDIVINTIKSIRPALGHTKTVDLYHGTNIDGGKGIITTGFRKPEICQNKLICKSKCTRDCPMLGHGIYFAELDKATSNVYRTAILNKETNIYEGALLWCKVDLGNCKIDIDDPCPCGCKMLYVDHLGNWMKEYDSIFLPGGTPVAKRSEWCVKNPSQIKVYAIKYIYLTDKKEIINEKTTEWEIL